MQPTPQAASAETADSAPERVTTRVLVVDDDLAHAEALVEGLERANCECETAEGATPARAALEKSRFDVVLTDLVMRDGSGLDVVRMARELDPEAAVVLLTGHGSIETAVAAMREGAVDYLQKPVQMDELRLRVTKAANVRALRRRHDELQRQNEELHRELDKRYGFEGIVGSSPPMQRLFETMQQIAPTDATVLVLGESGTGKELVARAIHLNSPRRKRPFVAINCAALSESLIESELFGHERGAFTGATGPREGKLEYASGGTLFLDEVGDMPLTTQTKFLRALEQREIERIGSNRTIKVDFRLIAATNQPLRDRVAEGKFREDLFFRLAVVQLRLVPLRERRADIPLLVDHFLAEFRRRHNKRIVGMSPAARALLMRYEWPGNVRELRNIVEAMVVTSRGEVLDVADVPPPVADAPPAPISAAEPLSLANRKLDEIERQAIEENLALYHGNREQVAKTLGIGERTLYRKLKEYGLS
ncbi:MAG: sigma-54-dependent Fis family transcriptional regulator [Planctomycetes bacterium]|nr:sigma-54-dependent Fis family transcriptional regulator [Planctomycetota bacterium]